jgi:hypothetical protein
MAVSQSVFHRTVMKRPRWRGVLAERRLKLSVFLYLKRLMRRLLAPKTSSAIRFASSGGFPAPNIFLITKLMLNAPA